MIIAAAQTAHAQQAAAKEQSIEREIIVTGSRVVLTGNDMPTPVTVMNMAQMTDTRPATVAEQLNDLPQFSGSQTQNTPQGSGTANAGNSNPSGNVLNLRNFGATRNLVLFDGHRVAPNSGNGTIDINMIPQLLLKRVDVVTGGVSAVYGSDAITGVVNFITDTKFKGLKGNAQYGISNQSDSRQKAFGLAWGGDLGDKGHLLLSYEYRDDEGIDSRSSRPWGAARYQLGQVGATTTVNGVPTATYRWVTQAARSQNSFGGTITSAPGTTNPLAGNYFNSPTSVTPMTGTVINPNVVANGTGGYFDTSLRAALRMHQLFGRFDYDVTDAVHFYVRGAYTDTRNEGYGIANPTYIPNSGNFVPVSVNNPYLPISVYNAITANGTNGISTFTLGKLYAGQNRQFTQTFGRNWSIDFGFNGKLGNDWRWEAAFIHSDNNQRTVANNAINGRKLVASVDAVNDGGTIKCWVNTAAGQAALAASPNAAALSKLYSSCVPQASLFGGTLSAAEADWLFDPLTVTTKIKSDNFEGFVSGSPFKTWAGPVSLAVSTQYRKQSYEVLTSSSPATSSNPLDCAGLRTLTGSFACTPTSLEYFQAESYPRSRTTVSVTEFAAETQVPLLKDVAFAHSLSANSALRVTDYSTSGTVWTWKAGLDWDVTSGLTLRGTRSRDIRAPTLHEMFQPQVLGSFNGTDALLGKSLSVAPLTPAGQIASGNPALKPEKGNTLTLGLVYRPEWLRGFSLAVDYFDISVKDAIVTLNGSDSSTQNDCIASKGTSPTCSLIVRPIDCCTTTTNANAITATYQRPLNIARQYTRGVDVELNYNSTLANRPFSLRLLGTYQPKNVVIDGITGVQTNYAGSAFAPNTLVSGNGSKLRATLIASMEVAKGLRVTLQERYLSAMSFTPQVTGTATTTPTNIVLLDAPANIPAKIYSSLNVSYKIGPAEVFANVQNLFNVQPAPWASYNSALPGNNGVAPGHDPIGRYFTMGVRARL